MNKSANLSAILGCLFCLFGVLLGAFGAHALNDILQANQRESVYELATRYQFYHGLALLVIAMFYQKQWLSGRWITLAMAVGTLIFSGSLYLLAITDIGVFGAITPIGGTALLLAWLLVLKQLWSQKLGG